MNTANVGTVSTLVEGQTREKKESMNFIALIE